MQNTDIKFSDLKIISTIDQTHQETTTIYLAHFNQNLVVCKAIKKSYFDDQKKVEHLQNEKEALYYFTQQKISNVNHIICTFKDENHIYFILQPAYGLPLHKLMKMADPFDPKFVSMIAVQIALILKQFHKHGFIYRDIKASNFVIDVKGKVTMIDLGKSKRIHGQRTNTLCGTTHAIPPQILLGQGKYEYSYEFDCYGFGILIYELLVGRAPFGYQKTNPKIKEDIQNGLMPDHLQMIKDEMTADLITKLLNPPEYRLVLTHPYFQNINMSQIQSIMKGESSLANNYNFKQYQSEIQDFGVEIDRYDEIKPDDPFYNF